MMQLEQDMVSAPGVKRWPHSGQVSGAAGEGVADAGVAAVGGGEFGVALIGVDVRITTPRR
jgi:hypothetical protein